MSFHPQTPQSPSKASPATTSSDQPLSVSTSTTSMTSVGTLLTPAHSVNGSNSQPDSLTMDETPHKRKRALDDQGDRDTKKMDFGDRKPDLDDLHMDVGHKYLLCQTPYRETLPRITDDLYAMFNLESLAAEVAREKPNGEKNALRKTYKGHIKRLGVAGHFDVTKKQEDAPSEFMSLVNAPELEWNVHQVKGREIGDGLSEMTLSALGRAMTMAKGPIARQVWDTSVLGDFSGPGERPGSTKPTAPGTPSFSAPSAQTSSIKTQGALGQDPLRPKRNIKKRTYGDSSFDGYGEGFPDDDTGADTGYDTGDGEGLPKRRKNNTGDPSPYPEAIRKQSYGPGMVGA